MTPLVRGGQTLGEYFETDYADFVFGGVGLTRDRLAEEWPKDKFHFLKQVHGTRFEKAPFAETPEADGQYTTTPHIALTIQTADCVPVLMANRREACALHAGWRGVAAGIAFRSREFFQQAPLVALLGPHIQFSSFEVGRDVANELLKSLPPGGLTDSYLGQHSEAGKVYFNLRELIAAQLRSIYPGVQIFASNSNTLIDRAFHSYRRNGPQAGRQYSFVVLKP